MRRISGTYKFKMRTSSPNSNNEYAILLEISKSGKRGYISLKIWGDCNDWDEEQERFIIKKGLRTTEAKKANEDRKHKNDFIEKQNLRANDIISQFEKDNVDWTVNQFKTELTGKKNHGNVSAYFRKQIEILTDIGHVGSARVYSQSFHMLELFDKNISSRVFSEIDLPYIKSFELFLQKRNLKGNSRSVYHRTIKAVINKAIQDKESTVETYPYGKGGFQTGRIETRTTKKYLPTEQLEILKITKVTVPTREYARCIFLFSYYCHGINIMDMARLKNIDVEKLEKGNYIVYKREKTKTQKNSKWLSIRITPEITKLIAKMQEYKKPIDDYLLPIVTVKYDDEVSLYKHIEIRRKRINKYLTELGQELGFELKVTSNVSRHTMAMQLKNNDIRVEAISQILGHQDIQTTQIYLDDLDTTAIDEAVNVL